MLCSDGLTKHISEEEISKILAAEVSAEESCCKLVKRALDEGGSDNVTVVVARFVNNT